MTAVSQHLKGDFVKHKLVLLLSYSVQGHRISYPYHWTDPRIFTVYRKKLNVSYSFFRLICMGKLLNISVWNPKLSIKP